MNLLKRDYKKLDQINKEKEERKEGFKKLKEENIGIKDTLALILAMFQLILPFAIGIVVIYYIIILFLTKVWMQ